MKLPRRIAKVAVGVKSFDLWVRLLESALWPPSEKTAYRVITFFVAPTSHPLNFAFFIDGLHGSPLSPTSSTFPFYATTTSSSSLASHTKIPMASPLSADLSTKGTTRKIGSPLSELHLPHCYMNP